MSEKVTKPKLSVVITISSDSTAGYYDPAYLTRCLDSITSQSYPTSIDISVPFPSHLSVYLNLQEHYPEVNFLPLYDPEPSKGPGLSHRRYDALRAYGLTCAGGEIIAMIEDQEILEPDWAVKMIEAHKKGYAVIGGAVENGVDRPLNWAVYFCDFLNYQNPIIAGETSSASDVNISYKRDVLQSIRSTWQDGFHEPVVHREIIARGFKIGLDPKALVYQRRDGLVLNRTLIERFVWGRHFGALRQRDFPRWKALIYSISSLLLPFILIIRKTTAIMKKERNRGVFFKVLPLTFLLLIFWSFGEMVGYLTAKS